MVVRGSPRGVKGKVLDWRHEVINFEIQLLN